MLQKTVYNYAHSSQIKDYLIFKDISILIYGNIVIIELSLRQRAVNNFRDKSDPARDTGRQTSIPGLSRPFRDGWQPCARLNYSSPSTTEVLENVHLPPHGKSLS